MDDKTAIRVFVAIILMVFLTVMVIIGTGCTSFSLPPQPEAPTNVLQEPISGVLQNSLRGLTGLSWWCIIGVGLSVFAFINGSKWAIPAAVACLTALSLNLAVLKYSTIVSIIGLVGAAGISVYTIFLKNKALKEIVRGGENFKDVMRTTNKHSIAGCFNVNQDSKQSPSTQKIVKKIKEKK